VKPKHPTEVVLAQAEDEGLWFNAEHSTEAYLQQELRKLHKSVEDYFSAENMPGEEEIEKARIEYFDSGDFRLNDSIWHSACKWALERMKR
jgi:hypothetical protein